MDTLDDVLSKNDIVLIDFWAEWCGPCKMFGPVFEKSSDNNPDIAHVKVNTEEDQQLAAAFGIQSIPTLAIFREKIMIYKQPGALPESGLEDIIKQIKELDMEKIKAEVEAQKEETEATAE
jgi:thioredoxin 1